MGDVQATGPKKSQCAWWSITRWSVVGYSWIRMAAGRAWDIERRTTSPFTLSLSVPHPRDKRAPPCVAIEAQLRT